MNNQTYTTKNYVKQNISACGRSAQWRFQIIPQCKAFALYQEEQTQGCSPEELSEATRAGGERDCVMFVS